jgi:hypothetical protein
MSNGRSFKRKPDKKRDGGGFVAMPWSVLDSPGYLDLSHPARSLLMELARQYDGRNNGRLLTSAKHLKTRGWNSSAVITRAKRELLKANLIHELVMGHRPNKASWYALTWQKLDHNKGYDAGTAETFRQGAYKPLTLAPPKPTREELYERWRTSEAGNDSLGRLEA